MTINFLKKVLSDNKLFQQIINSYDRHQVIQEINPKINLGELFEPPTMCQPKKLWEIFSRIRFEYVRPTCTGIKDMPKIFPFISEEDLAVGLKSYFLSSLNPSQESIEIFRRYSSCPEKSVGKILYDFHQKYQEITRSNTPSMFPSNYILVHDFHHILLGVSPNQQDELAVLAFEEGMLNRCPAPLLLLEQIQIFLESKGLKMFETERLYKAWNIGANCYIDIFDDFPLLDYLNKDLEETRYLLNAPKLN